MKGYKLCVLGHPGVGKTSMIKRYETDEFPEKYGSTIGLDFITKTIEIEREEVILSIWDMGGSTRNVKIEQSFFKGMHGCLLVYDITNRHSFNELHVWTNKLIDYHDITSKNVIKILAGNKKDLESSRQIDYGETQEYWKRNAIPAYETSAKTGENIEKVFTELITDVYKSHNR
jgi:small GTP-binding protein